MSLSSDNRILLLLFKQTHKIIYFCNADNLSVNTSVHEIRKSVKRIRAWLRFFKDNHGKNPFEEDDQRLHEWVRVLTDARESFVNYTLFDHYFSNKQFLPEKKVKQIIDALNKENQYQINKLYTEDYFSLIKNQIHSLILKTEQFKEAVPASSLHNELSETYEQAYALFFEGEEPFSREQLHKLRIKLKQLWFQFEAVKPAQARYFTTRTRQLNEGTEILGNDHDNFILLQHLRAHYWKNLSQGEQKMAENLMARQHERTLSRLSGKLKMLFRENPEAFRKKITSYIVQGIPARTTG
jgi:CHAD domain-containing protein